MNLDKLYTIIKSRKKQKSKDSYVYNLFKKGQDAVLQKIGEEATEVIIAAKNRSKKEIIFEISDLLFMILIFISSKNISLNEIYEELERRNTKKTTSVIQNAKSVYQGDARQ